MGSEDILAELIGRGILEEVPGDDAIAIDGAFRALVDEEREHLEDDEAARVRLEASIDDPDLVETLDAIRADDPAFVAHYLALAARTDALGRDELARTAAVLVQFEGEAPEAGESPDGFLPVRGDQLPTLVRLTRRAIVYVWKYDCEPCELVRGDLEEIFDGPADDIALFSVYGPDWAEELYEAFDVAGAPTTLFVVDGEVDARLQGAFAPEVLEGEVELLRELA